LEVDRRYEGRVVMKCPRFRTDFHPANAYVERNRCENQRTQTALDILQNGALKDIKEKSKEAFEFVEKYFENAGFDLSSLKNNLKGRKSYLESILDCVDGLIKHCEMNDVQDETSE